ncbi:uncharacterized protein HMPREF1541_04323 [Cyphellophora europaea CBS 101466]|uniref:Prephenate dehydratase domain-containing protein n=1 Tax=Cyphellophora europaea (strain CBS 101466) TaxID=1220924 RepID=W2RWB0_CYPE1|nr:uncharacterized protein HMPREF1541_04323 [Cyphellophora europaea CBS 101466]ETN40048.1 hypothetical protein HMPREF1541_04323 [Cyphellophora europaea CBS 101466]
MTTDPLKKHILYLGPNLSFSHAAVQAVFPGQHHTQCSDFPQIFSRLQHASQDADASAHSYAIVPVCNSTNGPVIPVVALLRQCGDGNGSLLSELAEHGADIGVQSQAIIVVEAQTSVVGQQALPSGTQATSLTTVSKSETYLNIILRPPYTYHLPVHHYLYVHPDCPVSAATLKAGGDDEGSPSTTTAIDYTLLTTLHTHPQVWTQCSTFLRTHLSASSVTHVDHNSTSEAASLVARTTHAQSLTGTVSRSEMSGPAGERLGWPAAICSRQAGEAYGLKCVAAHIEDDREGNRTTFAVLGVEPGKPTEEG